MIDGGAGRGAFATLQARHGPATRFRICLMAYCTGEIGSALSCRFWTSLRRMQMSVGRKRGRMTGTAKKTERWPRVPRSSKALLAFKAEIAQLGEQ